MLRVFPKQSVVGVCVDANPALKKGDRIVLRSNEGFEELGVESIKVKNDLVDDFAKGEVGLKVTFNVKKIIDASFVYRLESPVESSEVSPVVD